MIYLPKHYWIITTKYLDVQANTVNSYGYVKGLSHVDKVVLWYNLLVVAVNKELLAIFTLEISPLLHYTNNTS